MATCSLGDGMAGGTLRPHRHSRAIVETPHRLTFWTLLKLIGRQMQTCLDERVIEHAVLFAAGDEGEASQINEHGPRAILAVESQKRACLWELVRGEIARDRSKALAEFYT